jgi:hypothetical protein
MSQKVSRFMGGLGLDATGVFEVEANSTVTVGGGSGNVVVGTVTAGASGTSGQINAPESFVINIDSDNNSTTRAFVIKNNGSTEIARFTESGRLGLGTDSPDFKAEIVGGTNDGLHIKDAESATVFGGLFTQSVNLALIARSDHALTFGTNDTERMRITSGGKVGIGTASPSTTLDVAGNVSLGTNSSNTITLTGSIDLGTL